MRQRFYIIPQRYPCYDGSTPLTWAVYYGRHFYCYSWSYEGAVRAIELIEKGRQ